MQNEICKNPLDTLVNDTNNNNASINSALDLLTHILEVALKENNHDIPKNLESHLSKACDELRTSVQDSAILTRVAKVQVLLRFALTHDKKEDVVLLEEKILEIVAHLLDSKKISIVQTVVLQCQSYWCILKTHLTHQANGYQLDQQLVYIQVRLQCWKYNLNFIIIEFYKYWHSNLTIKNNLFKSAKIRHLK